MFELMAAPERVYHNMIDDIYGIGSVLHRKFAWLRISYLIFMTGITVSVLLFIAIFIVNAGNTPAVGEPLSALPLLSGYTTPA
jgi:hypothetical protein